MTSRTGGAAPSCLAETLHRCTTSRGYVRRKPPRSGWRAGSGVRFVRVRCVSGGRALSACGQACVCLAMTMAVFGAAAEGRIRQRPEASTRLALSSSERRYERLGVSMARG